MTRKINAKVGEYEKNGETKGEYVRLGVILSGEHGEYALLDPTVNLAGVLQKQNRYNHSKGKRIGDMVIASIFDDSRSQPGNSSSADGGQEAGNPPNDLDELSF